MSFKSIVAAALAAPLLAGCATQGGDLALSADPNFGEASRYNAAVQTIDPAPVYAVDGAQPGDHGEKGAAAVERYRNDQVKSVEQIRTSSDSGGGGGPQ